MKLATDRRRLRELISAGRLVDPQGGLNFADLAGAMAHCCGVTSGFPHRKEKVESVAAEIGGRERRHVILVLCDGMGNSVLEEHLGAESFLRRHNAPGRFVAVFPSTTPAALTTLATAAWPGQHGMPGWDLRDQKGCDFPGHAAQGPVQLRCLAPEVMDVRAGGPLPTGPGAWTREEVFVAPPWTALAESHRRMLFVNAYNGTDFPNWYEGPHTGDVATIPETVSSTLGTPEGAAAAVEYFGRGVDSIVARLREAEGNGWQTYTYLYSAHPDKHMHALGVEHAEVGRVVQGLDRELGRLWEAVGAWDTALVVTADHGHVTVHPASMVTLPDELLRCLEYANIGVHGKGRHAYFHCRSGLRGDFEALWAGCARLRESFLLLAVEDAIEEGLFGPDPPLHAVRPRLGDFVAISLGADTLVTPGEAEKWAGACQGAHGSLTPEDMGIPFVLCTRGAA